MEHSVAFMISTLSRTMTLKPGDLILVGVNHSYLGPRQDGDLCDTDHFGLALPEERASHRKSSAVEWGA